MEDYTIIEGRDQYGKLHDLWFDETDFYIERAVKGYLAEGWSEFSVVQNPRKYKLTIRTNMIN